MTYIPVNFDEAVESSPAPAGRYKLQITGCDIVKTGAQSKNPGRDQLKASIGFTDLTDVPNISQFISLPHENDEPETAKFKVLLLKRFLELFQIPYDRNGIDVEKIAMEMVGNTAEAEVTLSPPNDSGNVYNNLVVPRIKGEPEARGKGTPPSRKR